MNLEDQPGFQLFFFQPLADMNHRNFDDVRRGSLDRRIHSHPLSKRPLHEIGRFEFRHRTASSVQSRHITILFRIFHESVQEALDPRIGLKIFFNIFGGLLPADAEILA